MGWKLSIYYINICNYSANLVYQENLIYVKTYNEYCHGKKPKTKAFNVDKLPYIAFQNINKVFA